MMMLRFLSVLDVAPPPDAIEGEPVHPALMFLIALLIVALVVGAVLLILHIRRTGAKQAPGKRNLR